MDQEKDVVDPAEGADAALELMEKECLAGTQFLEERTRNFLQNMDLNVPDESLDTIEFLQSIAYALVSICYLTGRDAKALVIKAENALLMGSLTVKEGVEE